MNISIRNTGEIPIYDQITRQVKAQILSGQLTESEAMPSIRVLAQDLRISVITTKRAYDELTKEGYLVVVPSKGYYVAPRDLELAREEGRRRVEEHLALAVEAAQGVGMSREELLETLELLYQEE